MYKTLLLLIFLTIIYSCSNPANDIETPVEKPEVLGKNIVSRFEKTVTVGEAITIPFHAKENKTYNIELRTHSHQISLITEFKVTNSNNDTIAIKNAANDEWSNTFKIKESGHHTLEMTVSGIYFFKGNKLDSLTDHFVDIVLSYYNIEDSLFNGTWFYSQINEKFGPYEKIENYKSPGDYNTVYRIKGEQLTEYYISKHNNLLSTSGPKHLSKCWLFACSDYIQHTLTDSTLISESIIKSDIYNASWTVKLSKSDKTPYELLKDTTIQPDDTYVPTNWIGNWYFSKHFIGDITDIEDGKGIYKEEIISNATNPEESNTIITFKKDSVYAYNLSTKIKSEAYAWNEIADEFSKGWTITKSKLVNASFGPSIVEVYEYTKFEGSVPPIEWLHKNGTIPKDEAIVIKLNEEKTSINEDALSLTWYKFLGKKSKTYQIIISNGDMSKTELFVLDETGKEYAYGDLLSGINPTWKADESKPFYIGIKGKYTIEITESNTL